MLTSMLGLVMNFWLDVFFGKPDDDGDYIPTYRP